MTAVCSVHRPAASDRNFGYDALQRLVSGGTVASPESYTYDAQDQLIRIDFPDTTFATYAYDALGRRIAKDVDDGAGGREVTAYVYDGADILMEFDTGSGWEFWPACGFPLYAGSGWCHHI